MSHSSTQQRNRRRPRLQRSCCRRSSAAAASCWMVAILLAMVVQLYAWTMSPSLVARTHQHVQMPQHRRSKCGLLDASPLDDADKENDGDDDEFASFAESLEEKDEDKETDDENIKEDEPLSETVIKVNGQKSPVAAVSKSADEPVLKKAPAATNSARTESTQAKTAANASTSSVDSSNKRQQSVSSSNKKKTEKSWQADLEELLDPATNLERRQALLQQLLFQSGPEIRASVQQALKDGNIDPLLTPTQKKFQQGTRAVARQLSNDILPSLAETATAQLRRQTSASSSAPSSSSTSIPLPPLIPPPSLVGKVGTRMLNAFSNQLQKNLETFQDDLTDPSRIPKRLSAQTTELVKEATNVFAETPIGLLEPSYTVVATTDEYEIRDYDSYMVASTSMMDDENYDASGESGDPVVQMGAAFNSLASYVFGANRQRKSMDMTTPVTTTWDGEMRFYLSETERSSIPDPLEQDEAKSVYETGRILVREIPPARLAVRRFTGFVTKGEIARQKEALLTALELDGVELDVPHGQAVGHVIFQYNPPYTIPVIRRNEIAIPVVGPSDEVEEVYSKELYQNTWESATEGTTDDDE